MLATPHSQHAEQVTAAAAAGKHIHVEKPLTLDRPSARGGRRRRARTPASCWRSASTAASTLRWSKSASASPTGQLGQVMSMVATHTTTHRPVHPADNWRAQPDEAPGGAITAVGVHSHRPHDRVRRPGARRAGAPPAATFPAPSDDTTNVMLRFKSGATGLLFCSVATATTLCFTLFGSKGLAEFSASRTCARFRFVPVSTVAPTGPVTAPPDEIIEKPTPSTCSTPSWSNSAAASPETALSGRRSTRCCTAWRCSTPWYDRRKSRQQIEKRCELRKRHGKTDHHRRRRLAHVLPAQQPLPAAGGHRRRAPSNTSMR